MNILSLCIKKPVIAIVISLTMMVLGLVAYQRLDIRFFPKQTIPMVQIKTKYEGASAALMESNVTSLLESALAGVDGIESIVSSSGVSWSTVTVYFKQGGDFSRQINEVRDKISQVKDNSSWPSRANEPTLKIGGNGQEMMILGFADPKRSGEVVRNWVHDHVLPVIQQIPGVGGVSLRGASDYAMRIWLDPLKMASLGVTVSDVQSAISSENIDFSAGSIRTSTRNFAIVSNTKLKNPSAFANIVIKQSKDAQVRLADIAQIEFGNRSFEEAPLRINGQLAVSLTISPVQGVNPISLSEIVKKTINRIQESTPEGMRLLIIYDQSQFLNGSIHETQKAIIEAIVLVIAVILVFLGSFRAALVPIVTIPVSLVATFAAIYVFGFSINTMSLLGLVLAIGLVVDDAIVMLENIYRHIEMGLSAIDAALIGSREIATAVIAMSFTLFSVYVPIGLVQGVSARLFQEFAFTLASAVIISGVIALTLSPMMSSLVLNQSMNSSSMVQFIDRVFAKLTLCYKRALNYSLLHRKRMIGMLIPLIVLAGLAYSRMPSEFLPQEDTGLFSVHVQAPAGASIAYSDTYNRQIERLLAKESDIAYYLTEGGGGGSDFSVVLKPWGQRKTSPMHWVSYFNQQFSKLPGVDASAFLPSVIDFGEQGSDVDINLLGSSYDDILLPMKQLMENLRGYPGLTRLSTNLKFDAQQYSIHIDRDLASVLGVKIEDIAHAISVMISGNHITDIQSDKRSYAVIIQMKKEELKHFNVLDKIYVPGTITKNGVNQTTPIALSSLVTLTPTIGQSNLHHFNRFKSATISARLSPGVTESQVIEHINAKLKSLAGPNIQFAYSGKAQQFLESQGSMLTIMLMSLLFVYLCLSLQFTSFIDPLVILFVVPFSMVGALLALWLSGGTINMYSQIGLVTLMGMISKHGILITQFINKLRSESMDFQEAIIEGASIRLRPILMTTLAMVFGALPLALASGPGSVGREQIGWTIVGGLLLGTVFSLFLVPMAYSFLGVFKRFPQNPKT